MAETSPLLESSSLATHGRHHWQRQAQRQAEAEDDRGHGQPQPQRPRSLSFEDDPGRARRPRQQQRPRSASLPFAGAHAAYGRRRSSSPYARRHNSLPPLLPVILEGLQAKNFDDASSLSLGSPGSGRVRRPRAARSPRAPPEAGDRRRGAAPHDGDGYGSFEGMECGMSTSSSDEDSHDYQRYRSSEGYRRSRQAFTYFFAFVLSAAVWLPLLQREADASVEGGRRASNSSEEHFGSHHRFHDEAHARQEAHGGSGSGRAILDWEHGLAGNNGTGSRDADGGPARDDPSEELYRSTNPARSLGSFLTGRKADPTDHFVVGNAAGDADSIVSAVTLAYVGSMTSGDQTTPIVSISKDTLAYERPDVNLLLRLAGIDPADLLYIDDLEKMLGRDKKQASPRPSMTLVDHNTLNPSLKRFRDDLVVTDIVDHHEDRMRFEDTCSGERRDIAFDDGPLVASTATLVAERLRGVPPPYPSSVGLLLLGAILLDSANLDESVGTVAQRDRDAVGDLLSNTDWGAVPASSFVIEADEGVAVDADDLFDVLQRSRRNPQFWSSLSVKRALQHDYEEFRRRGTYPGRGTPTRRPRRDTTFGVSSVLVPGLDFLRREGFYSATLAFMESRQISFLAVAFAFYDGRGAFRRQLALVDRSSRPREWSRSLLASDAYRSADLGLQEAELPAELGSGFIFSSHNIRRDVVLFDQKNLASSQKKIGPMLKDFFDELK